MKDLNSYGLNTKVVLREILAMNRNELNATMNKALEKFPDRFTNYPKMGKKLPEGMFVLICEHLAYSHERILGKIIAYYTLTDPNEIKRIINWLGLDVSKSDEDIDRNFGIKRIKTS